MEDFKRRIHLFAFVEDIYWLERGGRISPRLAKMVRQLQKVGIRPILGIEKGEVTQVGKKFFAKNRAKAIVDILKKKNNITIALAYADRKEQVKKIEQELEKKGREVKYINEFTPVIGTHAGPGTLIAAYYFNK